MCKFNAKALLDCENIFYGWSICILSAHIFPSYILICSTKLHEQIKRMRFILFTIYLQKIWPVLKSVCVIYSLCFATTAHVCTWPHIANPFIYSIKLKWLAYCYYRISGVKNIETVFIYNVKGPSLLCLFERLGRLSSQPIIGALKSHRTRSILWTPCSFAVVATVAVARQIKSNWILNLLKREITIWQCNCFVIRLQVVGVYTIFFLLLFIRLRVLHLHSGLPLLLSFFCVIFCFRNY